METTRERTVQVTGELDVRAVLGREGAGAREVDGAWWRTSRTPEGPVTLRVEPHPSGVRATAWGPGADWALEQLPALLGLGDDPRAFDPPPGPLRDLWRRHPGLRVGRTDRVLEVLLPTIVAQRVTTHGAADGWRRIVKRFGEPAPGPVPLRLPPDPEALVGLGYAAFHPLNVERSRAEALLRSCRHARRLEEARGMPAPEAQARLMAVRGIGPWTAAHVLGRALGDPDAVPVGDDHLPNAVCWLLAGEPRGDDARMLELLEPYRGHRARVTRLIVHAGAWAPRFGPRTEPQDIRWY